MLYSVKVLFMSVMKVVHRAGEADANSGRRPNKINLKTGYPKQYLVNNLIRKIIKYVPYFALHMA